MRLRSGLALFLALSIFATVLPPRNAVAQTASCSNPDGCGTKPNNTDIWIFSGLLVIGGFLFFRHHPHPQTTSRPPGVTYTPPSTPSPTPGAQTTSGPGNEITPGPGTTSAESPPPTATPTEEPTSGPTPPSYSPQPSPSPTPPIPCRTWQTHGYMEPVQGAWQDDPTFEDRPNKQISLLKKPAFYRAEMPMIAHRDTVLFGIDRYEGIDGQQQGAGHSDIVIEGKTTCSVTEKVKVKFKLRDGGLFEDIGETGFEFDLPTKGHVLPNNKEADWRVTVDAKNGYPYSRTFTVTSQTAGYHVWAEIYKAPDEQTGFRVDVVGDVNYTTFPEVIFQPVLLSVDTDDPKGLLHDVRILDIGAESYARELGENGADYLPVKVGSVVTIPRKHIDLSNSLKSYFGGGKRDELVAKLTTRLTAMGVLGKAGRIVVLLRDRDFDEINPAAFVEYFSKGKIVGVAIDEKLIIMRNFGGWDTAFHEVLHTIPYLWSTTQMVDSCGRDYHNGADNGVANGVKMYHQGKLGSREIIEGKTAILGQGSEGFYIAQCTYAHLTQQLALSNDPPTLFVRAIARENGRSSFEPFYTTDSVLDKPAKSGSWSLVMRDRSGRQLMRAPFTPNWDVRSLKAHRAAEAVMFRFPLTAQAYTVELRSPHGIAAQETLSASAPSLAILQPNGATVARGTRSLKLQWRARSATGAPLLATVLYSAGGPVYDVQAFEQMGSSFAVKLDPHAAVHRIKVIVTDGTRSTERAIVLHRRQ